MTVKDYLKQIKKIDSQLRNKAVELEQAKELCLPAGVILDDISNLTAKRMNIIRSIEELPEAEYDVLHRLYVQHKTLYEVAADRDISYRLVNNIHGRALRWLESIVNVNE